MSSTRVSDGQIYVCGACGKTSPTRYGFDERERHVADPGWDESCMLNAVLCSTQKIDGKWQAIEP
jgi:hypothetical protein